MTHWLYVSPHLDDAVLGCGGTIAARIDAGHRVTVATVFTEGPGAVGALHERRRREDLEAAAVLGFEVAHLGFPDAPFRSPLYRDFQSIVFSDAGTREARAVTESVTRCLEELTMRSDVEQLVAPLGVGGHIDHRITQRACGVLGRRVPLTYYEECPYAFVPGAVPARWRELGARPLHSPLSGAPAPPWSWERLPFLDSYTAADRSPAACVERLRAAEGALGAAERGAAVWSGGDGVFLRVRRRLEPARVTRWVEGIAAYRSQLEDLFGASGSAGDPPQVRIRDVYEHHAALPEDPHWYQSEWVDDSRAQEVP